MLGNRLKACADFVKGKKACDVGTDHGYLAAELLILGKCDFVIAADINEKPLESARSTLLGAGLSECSQTVLSDGVKSICLDGVTDIIIAGMGGELIAEILSQKPLDGINLVLQPMTKAPYLRRFLAENGFLLKNEKAVEENGRLYIVMNVEFDGIKREITEAESMLGRLSADDDTAARLISATEKKLMREAEALENSGDSDAAAKKREIAGFLKKELSKNA